MTAETQQAARSRTLARGAHMHAPAVKLEIVVLGGLGGGGIDVLLPGTDPHVESSLLNCFFFIHLFR